jgi:hypothetical protein
MPQVDSLDELNERITGWEVADEARRITYHGTIIETGTHSYRLAHARPQHG